MLRGFFRIDIASLALLLLVLGPAVASDKFAGLDPSKTHAVIVGVLHWKSPSLSTFAIEDRKDRELCETLGALGVPKDNIALILDQDATHDQICQTIRDVSRKAKNGDTFIFYYAGHGTSEDGKACLYNFDIDPENKLSSALTSSEIAKILQDNFRGGRVLIFADCCYSGALAKAAEELHKHGIDAATITSASDTVSSTSNWTFSYQLIELLRGNPNGDLDNDGAITLAEAATEVSDAMKFRENQDSGHSRFGIPANFRLSSTSKQRSQATVPEPYKLFEYVHVRQNDRWKPARLVDYRDGRFLAEIQYYATREIVSVEAKDVRKWQKPPKPNPLALREALAKARVDGKYGDLLEIIEVESDAEAYSAFEDYGRYPATSYAGHANLPEGYWVYVYPNWYIWKDKLH